ncbi:MAG: hypothetical protein ACHRXM_31605, partial [Isosphaerales bacterium]
ENALQQAHVKASGRSNDPRSRSRQTSGRNSGEFRYKLGIVGARQPGVMATVQGMGGMGKTELALAYGS